MAEAKSLQDLKGALKESAQASAPVESNAPVHVRKVDENGRSYATGKRKASIAKVWIKPGKGQILINGKKMADYFGRQTQQMTVEHPLRLTNRDNQYDIICTVLGGGLGGQAGAIRHGVSKALTYQEPELRTILKRELLIRRDSRVVERKKYGQPKARRRFQFSKR